MKARALLWVVVGTLFGSATAGARTAPIVAASHHGQVKDDHIVWETHWQSTGPRHGLTLAYPLPEGSQLLPGQSSFETTVHEQRVHSVTWDRWTASGVVLYSVPLDPQDPVLKPPLIEGTFTQRITLEGARFVPDEQLGLTKRVGYWGPQTFDLPNRHAWEREHRRQGGTRARTRDQAIYLRADHQVRQEEGLSGQLLSGVHGASWAVQATLGGLCALLLLIGAALHRGLDSLARREKNDAYIRSFGGHSNQGATEPP